MQLQGLTNAKGHGLIVPLSILSGVGCLGVGVARGGGPSPSAGCFTTFPSGDARLFTREFVRRPFLMRRTSTLGGDCALRLRIHGRESARCLATDTARSSRIHSAVVSASASPSCSARSASLVHSFPLGIGLVRHYRSPLPRFSSHIEIAAYFDIHHATGESVESSRALGEVLMRKRQAAISGRGEPLSLSGNCGFLHFSHVCEPLTY